MNHKADNLGPIPIGGHYGPEEQRRIHTGEMQRLAGSQQGRQQPGCKKPPEQHVTDMHDRLFLTHLPRRAETRPSGIRTPVTPANIQPTFPRSTDC